MKKPSKIPTVNKNLTVKGKTYELPIYLPDATRGLVKTIDSTDIKQAGIEGVVVNTYHLITHPGLETIEKFGGIKKFMNFDGLVVSDSGGWQMFSLIHRDAKLGKITDGGVVFKHGIGKKTLVTPEEVIQSQFKINSDILICLDDFTPPNADARRLKESVERTIYWAKRCKTEYLRLLKEKSISDEDRPLLFSVIQGGFSKEMRKKCAEELIKIGFDGYGFGGYVVDENGNMDMEISEYLAGLIPENSIKFALGSGKPKDIVNLRKMGWDIFDCTLPTRDARHKRLYLLDEKTLECSYIYINKQKYKNDISAVDENCDCHLCKNFSKAYLYHLFNIGDPLAFRLATIHNLRVYGRLTELLQKAEEIN